MAKKATKATKAKTKKQGSADAPLRRSCGAMAAHMMLLEMHPSFRAAQMRLEGVTAKKRDMSQARMEVVTIRTVVNVVYATDEQNIPRAQILSQITALNKDFRATNADAAQTPPAFQGLVTDACVEFKLVKITRTQTDVTGFSFDDKVKKVSTGGVAPYQPTTHMNLWVCALTGGLLGYAQFPGGPAGTDGVVINYKALGTSGTAQAPFNKGRTATHEVGHYLNLRHIWGDTPDCSGSDNVADTPNCAGPNFGAPASPVVTCNNGPNGDMFMNYMDYTDDEAMFMFTAQQVLRMRATLDTVRSGILG